MNLDYRRDLLTLTDDELDQLSLPEFAPFLNLRIRRTAPTGDAFVLSVRPPQGNVVQFSGSFAQLDKEFLSRGVFLIDLSLESLSPIDTEFAKENSAIYKVLNDISQSPLKYKKASEEKHFRYHGDMTSLYPYDIWDNKWILLDYNTNIFTFNSKTTNIIVDDANLMNHKEIYVFEQRAVKSLSKWVLESSSAIPYVERALLMKEIADFKDALIRVKSNICVYNQFLSGISSIYERNVRQYSYGGVDVSKVVDRLSAFIKREALLGSLSERWQRDALASDLIEVHQARASQRSPVVPPSGIDFEQAVAVQLRGAGFRVDTTPTVGDFGADLILEKDELRYAVQCKAHSRPIGIKAVQEALGGRKYYKCDFAVVVSASDFTAAAEELATELKVVLITQGKLDQLEAIVSRSV